MAIESFADVSAGEIALHFKLSHVDRAGLGSSIPSPASV
jgi:hypothetical protein